ncbi:tryptophanase leader peptide [Escherichia coli]|nr:tryptophanase leader peptide [Escherichia coli]
MSKLAASPNIDNKIVDHRP